MWLEKIPGENGDRQPAVLERRQRMANNQCLADLNIWEHQRYTDPPALATAEGKGFRMIRRWAMQFYPEGEKGSAGTPETQTAGTDAGVDVPESEADSAHTASV